MTNRLACCVLLVAAVVVPVTAQTIRIGAVAATSATDKDVLVLHEYNKVTGQPYGTMSMRYVTEIHQRAGALLDIALLEPAFASAFLARDDIFGQGQRDVPRLRAGEATFNALGLLGIQPALGRDFTEADVRSGSHLAVLTAGAWERLFKRSPDVIGKAVWTSGNGRSPLVYAVIGVLPPGVLSATPELDPDLDVILLAQTLFEAPLTDERAFAPIVRLKPGVSLDRASAAVDAAVIAAQRVIQSPNYPGFGARLDTLRR